MSLMSGLFLLLGVMIGFLLCIPLQFQFVLHHQERWSGAVMVKILVWEFTLYRFDRKDAAQAGHRLEQMGSVQQRDSRLVKICWKDLFSFGSEILHILAKRLRLQQLSVRCCIGWERADYTAYGCGLFWAFIAMMPTHWLERSDVVYEPDFQLQRKELAVEGIIYCTMAQLIAIQAALIRITVREVQQIRKEQMIA